MDHKGSLIWLDLEMTGLDPRKERIIEIATIVTDSELNIVAEGPELVVHQEDAILDAMDDWNKRQHGKSGLIEAVRASTVTEQEAEDQTLRFISAHCKEGSAPLAGNSVHHDRRFLIRYMPKLDDFLHYRIVDVSTLKELALRWYVEIYDRAPAKVEAHRALDDIRASIEELRYYRKTLFKPS